MSDYNPVECLQEEVDRFKRTNTFSPMMVTGFYIQAAVVLNYLKMLEEQMDKIISRAEYVCAHKFGENDPVGTRIIAVSDLHGEIRRAKKILRFKKTP